MTESRRRRRKVLRLPLSRLARVEKQCPASPRVYQMVDTRAKASAFCSPRLSGGKLKNDFQKYFYRSQTTTSPATQNKHEMSQKDRKRHRQCDKFRRRMTGD